jgi:flavin reductase (DIM6/NTAB) family NADH-FMN oxidoreductase RutF
MTDRYDVAKRVLSLIAHPVAIVGAAEGEQRSCATGTLMYVSHTPPLVATILHPGSRTARLAQSAGEFSISILREGQQDLAMRAGDPAPGPDKFAALGIPVVTRGTSRAPAVDGSIAQLWCGLLAAHATGDHLLLIGEVTDFAVDEGEAGPLLRFRRRYLRAGAFTSAESPEGYPT